MVQQPEWAKASSWSRIHDHTDTPQSVGLLWTCDQPDAETSTWQHTTLTTDIHAPGEIRTHNPCKRAAAGPLLRPQGHGTGNRNSLKHLKSDFFTLYTIQKYWQETTTHLYRVQTSFLQTKRPGIRFQILRVPALNEYIVWTQYIAQWMQYWWNPKTAVWS